MQKILFVSGSLSQNGTEMFMMNVLHNIDRKHFHIDFCIFDTEITPNRIEAEKLGCKVYTLPSRRKNPLKSVLAQFRFFHAHSNEYNAIHWHGGNLSSFFGFILYRFFGIPIRIVHAHSSCAVGLHNKILHNFHRLFIRRCCTHCLACSSESAKFFFRSSPAIIIKNGIDVKMFGYDKIVREEVRVELGINQEDVVIGHVGRFDDNKNQTFLLDVFFEYIKSNPNSYLLLVGNGETLDDMKKKAQELCIYDKVIFTGVRCDVNHLMQAMDCFVMPSKFEGLPFVLVEAQCSGLPCVISDSINQDVNITDNVHFVSLSSDAQNWSLIINNVLLNTTRESKANVIIKKGFSITDTVSTLQDIYSNKTD